MKKKQIFFTEPYKAELLEVDVPSLNEDEVLVKMEYTVISGGTEKACITAAPNTSGNFPMSLGYCGVGYVQEIGASVKSVKIGRKNWHRKK